MTESTDKNICFVCEDIGGELVDEFHGVLPMTEVKGILIIGKIVNQDGQPVFICRLCLAAALYNSATYFYRQEKWDPDRSP